MFPFGYSGYLAGAFALLSGFIQSYLVIGKLEKGAPLKKALKPIWITGLLLFPVHYIKVLFFNAYGCYEYNHLEKGAGVVSNLVSGHGLTFNWERVFDVTALHLIALSGFCIAVVMLFLFKNSGYKKIRKNLKVLVVIALGFFAVGTVAGPRIHEFVLTLYRGGKEGAVGNFFLILPLAKLFASQLSLFPLGGYAFIGVAMGMLFALDKERKNIAPLQKFSRITAAVSILAGIGFMILTAVRALQAGGDPVGALFDYRVYPIHLSFFNLGLIMFLIFGIVKKIEYAPLKTYRKMVDKTLMLRRFGMMSLTVYIMENVTRSGFSYLFHSVFGDPELPQDAFMTNAPAIILYLAVLSAFWLTVMWAWEKIEFKGSFEWMMAKVSNIFRKEDKTSKMNVQKVLYPLEEQKEREPVLTR